MPLKKSEFDLQDVEILEEKTLFQGFSRLVLKRLRHRLFKGGWSSAIERELFDRGEACAAILYDPEHDLVGLVEQFRVGALKSEYGPWCLEVVAGLIDPGETPDQVVRREIAEEANITEVELKFITAYYTTPGACNEKVYLYSGLCDLSQAGGTHGLDHENEDIRLHIIPADDVFAAMLNSRMNNASTLIGLQWLQSHRDSLRSASGH
jgi:ADP-ribose pyrophosphatase